MKLSFYLKFVLLGSAFFLLLGKPLSARDLTDVRTGFHKSYSRLVLEFNGPVRFQVLENKENQTIMVDIISGGEIRNFPNINIDPDDPFIRQVRFKKDGSLISVMAFLNNSYFKINQSQLNWPFRIVVDIYSSGTQLQTAVAHKTRATRKLDIADEKKEPVKSDSAKSILSVGTENITPESSDIGMDTTEQVTGISPVLDKLLVKPLDIESLTNPFARNLIQAQEPPVRIAETKTSLIWLIGGAFILLDVVLLAFYFLKQGKLKLPGKAAAQNANRNRKFRKNVSQPVKTKKGKLEKNKESLVNPAFLSYLNNALEKQQQEPVSVPTNEHQPDEIGEISKAIKLDTLIGTLTEAVTDTQSPTNKLPIPPEFKEIAVDLNLNNSGTTEETAKRDLIGEDGREFMQNIKRLYLN